MQKIFNPSSSIFFLEWKEGTQPCKLNIFSGESILSELEKKLQLIEERMRERLSSPADATLLRILMETLIDIREALEDFNRLFKIDINIDELETLQPRKIEYSEEWKASLVKICQVLISLYEKIDKKELAEKWKTKLADLEKISV